MNLPLVNMSLLSKRCYFLWRQLSNMVPISNFIQDVGNKTPHALDNVNNDLSELAPYLQNSYNLAAYINNSGTLQKLLQLGVNLNKIEKKPYIVERILKLDFDKDMNNQIMFIMNYVNFENIGKFITKNPLILCEPIEDLQIRINYMQSKYFNKSQIRQIIERNPFWLMYSTVRIDKRLGYFQQKFCLSGKEVRCLATQQPKIITYNLQHVNTNSFVIKEEMGFSDDEMKLLLLTKPNIWMISQKSLIQRFNYLHNVMKIPHSTIVKYPNVLLCRNFRVKQRHLFLENLGRAQYEPSKENYIPIMALVENTDIEFCKNYAKCNVDDFNTFLKTL